MPVNKAGDGENGSVSITIVGELFGFMYLPSKICQQKIVTVPIQYYLQKLCTCTVLRFYLALFLFIFIFYVRYTCI